MFGINADTAVFVRPGVTDLRLNFERLRALVITESKRCGLLRTGANSIEKPSAMAIGRGRSSRFFALIGGRNGCSTSSAFRRPVQFPKRGSNPRPLPQPITHPFTPVPGQGDPPCGEW